MKFFSTTFPLSPGADLRAATLFSFCSRLSRNDAALVLGGLLFVLYSALLVVAYPGDFQFDGEVYFRTAQGIFQGQLADPSNPEIIAPGYPLFLSLFGLLQWPLWLMRWSNALLLALGGTFFFRVLDRYVPRPWALILPLLFGLHPQLLRMVPTLMSESLTVFLLLLWMWIVVRLCQQGRLSLPWLLSAVATLAAIELTRSLFAYVALAGSVGCLLLLLVAKREPARTVLVRSFLMAAGSLILCSPFLAYTKSLTGENFCWATNSGHHLYSITSPYPGEWGSWLSPDTLARDETARHHHLEFLQSLREVSVQEREEAYTAKAREHLQAHPQAWIRNIVANTSRYFFGFPWSYQNERLRTHLLLWPHALLLACFALTLWPAVVRLRHLPPELLLLLAVAIIYTGGSLLLPANPRYFVPIIPFLLLWIAFVWHHFLEFRIRLRPVPKPEALDIRMDS